MKTTNAMTDYIFLQIFKEFNEKLKNQNQKTGKAGNPYIGVISHPSENITCAVSPKDTPEMLVEAIEEAIRKNGDYKDVSILKVEEFEYGYELEITVVYTDNGEQLTPSKSQYYITHTTVY